ncbi:hypothetical protein AB4Y35_37820 [Paraburkholderia sp. EG286A]|uniref:hypothetical protein n=1 Tax=unclassified Paraburkholderia TaxID=2615204 RepID=UPI0034D1BA6C
MLGSTLVAFKVVAANYLAPKYVFDTLLSSTGAIALVVYLVIAISQLKLRSRLATTSKLKVKMWLHPCLGLLVVGLIVGGRSSSWFAARIIGRK